MFRGIFGMKISVFFPCETGLKRRRRENVKKREEASSSFDFALKIAIITIGKKVVSANGDNLRRDKMMKRQERFYGL